MKKNYNASLYSLTWKIVTFLTCNYVYYFHVCFTFFSRKTIFYHLFILYYLRVGEEGQNLCLSIRQLLCSWNMSVRLLHLTISKDMISSDATVASANIQSIWDSLVMFKLWSQGPFIYSHRGLLLIYKTLGQ